MCQSIIAQRPAESRVGVTSNVSLQHCVETRRKQLCSHHRNNRRGAMMCLQVSSGDVVILGSDGLWDNVPVPTLTQTVTQEILKGSRPSIIAQRLAGMAFEAAMDKKGTTPYSEAASEEFDMIYSGGKPDDITVIVTHLQ